METMQKLLASYSTVICIAGYSTPFCLCTKTGICCKFTVFLSMLCATFRSLVIQIKPISLDFKTEEINWRFLKGFSLTLQPPSLRYHPTFKRSVEALREYCCFLPDLVVPSILHKINLKNDPTSFSGYRWDSVPKLQMLTGILSRHNSDISLYLVHDVQYTELDIEYVTYPYYPRIFGCPNGMDINLNMNFFCQKKSLQGRWKHSLGLSSLLLLTLFS